MQVSSIVWIRRDLRLHDHAALAAALAEEGPVQLVFVFDTEILARFTNKQDRRLTFLADTLCQMHARLKARGGGLLVLHGQPRKIMPALFKALDARRIVAASDCEPETRARDEAVAGHAELVLVKDHWLRAPEEVMKSDGTPYKIFTPYRAAWLKLLTKQDLAERVVEDKGRHAELRRVQTAAAKAGLEVLHPEEGSGALLKAIGYEKADLAGWQPEEAETRLHDFVHGPLQRYAAHRNNMADPHSTSQLSPYLRFGLLSVREVVRAIADRRSTNGANWLSEIVWRDFFAAVLYHFPVTAKEEFQEKYRRKLSWRHSEVELAAWKEGRTGYPAVDAGMRQLLEMGWMHNRARMITATFFCRHMRADWRIGEEYFAQHLMDYDLSQNVGNWQWCASTGADAQPYFRVFNPVSQGQKFDPEGIYVKRFVPELKGLSQKLVHTPWNAEIPPEDYPQPVLDIAKTREPAIAMFKSLRQE